VTHLSFHHTRQNAVDRNAARREFSGKDSENASSAALLPTYIEVNGEAS
jgi:hypothetical protein